MLKSVMTNGKIRLFLPLLGCSIILSGCGGGGKTNPSPAQAPQNGFDAAGGLPAGAAPGGAPAPPRSIKIGEFLVTIIADDEIKQTVSVPVHVISTDAGTADQLVGDGAPKYWGSPFKGANVRRLPFGQNGSNSATVAAPSVPAMDTLVLVADLAAPAGGNDFRILKIPLKLDYSNPIAPVANPIRVRLTGNGWQRES